MKKVELVRKCENDLGDHFFCHCEFCGKILPFTSKQLEANNRLTGRTEPYCTFCLRHQFYTKKGNNILPLSLRGFVGFIYYKHYKKTKQIWLAQIEDMIAEHERIGLLNPVFFYDPEPMMWFVDFERVGRSSKKVKVKEVKKTISNCLACFNPVDLFNVEGGNIGKYVEKFHKAIDLFHEKRYRPEGRRKLIPTVANCIQLEKNFPLENTGSFDLSKIKKR